MQCDIRSATRVRQVVQEAAVATGMVAWQSGIALARLLGGGPGARVMFSAAAPTLTSGKAGCFRISTISA